MCKKIFLSLLLLGVVSTGVTANAASVTEESTKPQIETRANVSDTKWGWSTFGDTGTKYTDARKKTNATSAYVNVQNFRASSSKYLQMYLVDANYKDFSKRLVRTVNGTGQLSIYNLAYEDRGTCEVRMAFYAPWQAIGSWSANGLWSPDSTQNYG